MADKKLLVRMKGLQLGGHTHIGVWVGFGDTMPEDQFSYLGKVGDIILRNEEWEAVQDLFGQIRSTKVEGKITTEVK